MYRCHKQMQDKRGRRECVSNKHTGEAERQLKQEYGAPVSYRRSVHRDGFIGLRGPKNLGVPGIESLNLQLSFYAPMQADTTFSSFVPLIID